VNASQSSYDYDADNFKTRESHQSFNDSGTVVTEGELTYYYFHTLSDINDLKSEVGDIAVYPNPGNGKFTISSNSTINAIEIFNLLGEQIFSNSKFNQQTSNEIDLSDQGKGIYFINIYDGTKIYNRKIVVQ